MRRRSVAPVKRYIKGYVPGSARAAASIPAATCRGRGEGAEGRGYQALELINLIHLVNHAITPDVALLNYVEYLAGNGLQLEHPGTIWAMNSARMATKKARMTRRPPKVVSQGNGIEVARHLAESCDSDRRYA